MVVEKKGTIYCYEKGAFRAGASRLHHFDIPDDCSRADPCNSCEGEYMWVAKDLDTGEGADYR